MSGLYQKDLELLAVWAEHGVPDDRPTQIYAVEVVLPRLWAEYQELRQVLDELMAEAAGMP